MIFFPLFENELPEGEKSLKRRPKEIRLEKGESSDHPPEAFEGVVLESLR